MSLTTCRSLKYIKVRVTRPLLRPHPSGGPSNPLSACPLLEKEECHHEGADLHEVRFPSGWGHEPFQGLSLPGHLAHQRPSTAVQREELWLRLVHVSRLGGWEPLVLRVTRLGLAALGLVQGE